MAEQHRDLLALALERAAYDRNLLASLRRCREEPVTEVQHSVDNGRALQDLLLQAAPRYIKAPKRARAGSTTSDES